MTRADVWACQVRAGDRVELSPALGTVEAVADARSCGVGQVAIPLSLTRFLVRRAAAPMVVIRGRSGDGGR